MTGTTIAFEAIQAARRRAAGIVRTTPLDLSATFSAMCGRQIYLKLENLQKTGSFKVRGALNKIQLLDPRARARGVVTASAGNHAQGVAYAARTMAVPVTVVMPETASFSKVTATGGYGASVVLSGGDYSAAYASALALAQVQQATFVHAFDDPEIIAGQGTLALEVLEQLPEVDTVVVPVGGGGLLAGVISALRGAGSSARVIAVQAVGASSLAPSLRAGSRIELAAVDTIADGLATRSIGALPFEIIRTGLAAAVEVRDAQIADAVLLLLERAKTVVEGAGAVGLAACLAGLLPATAAKVVVIVSGGNIDTNLLDRIINLGLVEEGRLFRFTTRLADRPGELLRLVTCVAACRANIHQIRHERAQPGLALTQASVTLELETRGREHIAEIEQALSAAGFVLQRNGAD
ncbi:MAG: threonine ammonia-lyase [Deltaproteobacteria bacterium]|nr:threonine ammonia-lyase [Deltaproteobacteria bacterium]